MFSARGSTPALGLLSAYRVHTLSSSSNATKYFSTEIQTLPRPLTRFQRFNAVRRLAATPVRLRPSGVRVFVTTPDQQQSLRDVDVQHELPGQMGSPADANPKHPRAPAAAQHRVTPPGKELHQLRQP